MIKCPKCGFHKMVEQMTVSSPSSMHDDGTMAGLVTGMSCPICAKWLEIDMGPKMVYDPRVDAKTTAEQRAVISIKAGMSKLSIYDKTVWAHRVRIRTMVKQETPIEDIMKFVCRADSKVPSRAKCIKGSVERLMSGRLEKIMKLLKESA